MREPRGLPLPARLVLGAAIVGLGAIVLVSATGGIAQVVTTVGGIASGIVDRITATPEPSPTPFVVLPPPTVVPPEEPYTNRDRVDVAVDVASQILRRPGVRVVLYRQIGDLMPTIVGEVPVGTTPRTIVSGVDLLPGLNRLSAVLRDDTNESEPSLFVDLILDQEAPVITITSPQNGATVNRDVITITGTTQTRSSLVARNEANSATASSTAGNDGAFQLTIALREGSNGIRITATDPAGNGAEAILGLRRGSGHLAASLTASTYRIAQADLPTTLGLEVTVIDPDGQPLDGGEVTFTLQIPGLQPIVSTGRTGGDGRAQFATTIPSGTMTGAGRASVLVDAGELGQTTDTTVITIAD